MWDAHDDDEGLDDFRSELRRAMFLAGGFVAAWFVGLAALIWWLLA